MLRLSILNKSSKNLTSQYVLVKNNEIKDSSVGYTSLARLSENLTTATHYENNMFDP